MVVHTVLAIYRDTLFFQANGNLELTDHEDETVSFNITLEHVLQFATGASSVPPLGFYPKPSIDFHSSTFPRANTCSCTIFLPLEDMT